jgi:hypothetical protein
MLKGTVRNSYIVSRLERCPGSGSVTLCLRRPSGPRIWKFWYAIVVVVEIGIEKQVECGDSSAKYTRTSGLFTQVEATAWTLDKEWCDIKVMVIMTSENVTHTLYA